MEDNGGRNSRPNIIFILADDLGYGDVGYNGGFARTPHLDAMASGENSVRLNRFYSGAPVCTPTRGTVLTGRNHNRYCLWMSNTAGRDCKAESDFHCPAKVPLPLSEISVAQILQKQGYRTAALGKWHLGDLKDLKLPKSHPVWNCSNPRQHGFDVWKVTERAVPTAYPNCACFNSTLGQCRMGHYRNKTPPPCTNYHGGNESDINRLVSHDEPIIGDDSNFLADEFGDFLSSTVNNFPDRPFFAYIAFHTVHKRYIASQEYFDQYENCSSRQDRDYYGSITGMDDAVGKIKALLNQFNLSDNTMIWFTSDNGPENRTPGSTGGLRGRKGELFEGGIRVPGIIEWPAVIKKNWVSSYPVVTTDFLPTVCDIVGVQLPSNRSFDGVSILPFLKRQDSRESHRNESIMWLFNNRGDYSRKYTAAITMNEYKLLMEYHKGREVAHLYNIVETPSESEDLSKLLPNEVNNLKEQLETWTQSLIVSAVEEVGCLKPPVRLRTT